MKINTKTIYILTIILVLGLVACFIYKSIKDTSAAQSDALNFYCKADTDFVSTVMRDWQEAVAAFSASIGSGGPIDPGGGGPPENPYIGVTKTAIPSGPFQNNQLPFSVQYTITVTAKQGNLTNIHLQYECNVTRDGPSIPCPSLSTSIPTPPAEISPGSPFTFSYSQTYTTGFWDSFVSDTIKVTAEISGVGNPTGTASASIIIGAPPTECFVLDSSWSAGSFKSNIESAISYLVSNMPGYATKICSGGNVDLRYDSAGKNGYWGFYHGSYVDFFDLGLGTEYNAKYTLIHEACHVLMGRTSLYSQYLNYPGILSETPRCFYSYQSDYYEERLCEAVTFNEIPCAFDANFGSNYPIHRQFVEDYIY